MNGIDISNWQAGIDLTAVNADFVICKATQGNYYISPDFRRQYEQGLGAGKRMGIYHYAGGCDALTEAKYFLSKIEDYVGTGILCLDWESTQNGNYGKNDQTWCKTFMDYVKEQTGVTMFLYASAGLRNKFKTLLQSYPLWAAQYPDYNKVYGYKEMPWNEGAYSCAIRQYTSMMYIDGWRSHLDANKAYISGEEWDAYAKGSKTEEAKEAEKISVDELAQQVLNGRWGNGAERKAALTEAGYDYDEVQAKVNELCSEDEYQALARRVINGEFGNGEERKQKLGAKYEKVQKWVNKLLLGS